MDMSKAEQAVRDLLLALDQDVDREGLKETPKRVAKMFAEQVKGSECSLDKVFTSNGFEGMVVVKNIPFVSCCEHHLVFFFGKAHIAYIPRVAKALGLSKMARLVGQCSRGFTIQETITESIATTLYEEVDCLGCMVVVEAVHGCMSFRGAKAMGSSTVTSVVKGVFRDVPAARSEFLSLLSMGEAK